MEKYNIVNFDDLKEGQYILGFGNHVLRWDFDTMGKPAYGIVPADTDDLDKIITALRAELAALRKAIQSALDEFPANAKLPLSLRVIEILTDALKEKDE